MKLAIAAVWVPTTSSQDWFSNGNTENIVGTVLQKALDDFDRKIFNLEVPLTDSKKSNVPVLSKKSIRNSHSECAESIVWALLSRY